MGLSEKMSAMMELLRLINTDDLIKETSYKSWTSLDGTSIIATDSNTYFIALELLAIKNSTIASRFSRKTIYKFIEDRLPTIKRSGEIPVSAEIFFFRTPGATTNVDDDHRSHFRHSPRRWHT